MIKYARGAIWWANLDDAEISKASRAANKVRPVLIMSNNEYNATHSTLTVLPITHQFNADNQEADFRVPIDTSAPGKPNDTSYVMCDQIRLIDKKDIENFYGIISDWEMVKVQLVLTSFLNLDFSTYNHVSAEGEEVDDV